MVKIVNETIYFIVYNVFIFIKLVSLYWNNLKNHFVNANNITPKHFEENRFNNLRKKPTHISFILDEEPSFKDLANLVSWCLLTKISFVSFYDYRGVLEKKGEKLEDEINKIKHPNDHILWHDRNSIKKNGFVGRKIHIKIVTKEDGKNNITKICRDFATNKEKLSHISIERVDECLKEQYGFPDPDVGVIFSKIFSLFNYPPWEIRLTEFFRENSHHNITFNKFVDILVKYDKVNQRWGT